MFEFNTLIVTKRGENIRDWALRNDGKPLEMFTVHKFPVSSQEQVDAILSHPSIKGWKYGISIGYAKY
jgi:hypothetical protein